MRMLQHELRRAFLAVAVALVVAPEVVTAQVIDTRIGGTTAISGGGQTSGETFVTPAGFPVLDTFSLWFATGDPFQGFVYQWNGTTPVGSALFASPVMTQSPVPQVPQQVTFNVGALALNPGNQYVAFVQTANHGGGMEIGYLATSVPGGGDTYASGTLVVGPSLPTNPVGGTWTSFPNDDEFVATLSPAAPPVTSAPEPASLCLLGTGLAGIGVVARRRVRS